MSWVSGPSGRVSDHNEGSCANCKLQSSSSRSWYSIICRWRLGSKLEFSAPSSSASSTLPSAWPVSWHWTSHPPHPSRASPSSVSLPTHTRCVSFLLLRFSSHDLFFQNSGAPSTATSASSSPACLLSGLTSAAANGNRMLQPRSSAPVARVQLAAGSTCVVRHQTARPFAGSALTRDLHSPKKSIPTPWPATLISEWLQKTR